MDHWALALIQRTVVSAPIRFMLWDGFDLPSTSGAPVATIAFKNRRALFSWVWDPDLNLGTACRRLVDSGVMLVGDAAGLAYAESGEGIRPAIESGLLAAATIIEADGQYTRNRLEGYRERLQARFAAGPIARTLSQMLSGGLGLAVASRLLKRPAFVRHVVLDRWFLHAQEPELVRTA